MAHIYAIDRLLKGQNIPDRAKGIAKKMYELDKMYKQHNTPYLVGTCGEWKFSCYTDHYHDPKVVIYRTIGAIRYIVTTLSFEWTSKVFPEFSDEADWEYWNFTGDDFMVDGKWVELGANNAK